MVTEAINLGQRLFVDHAGDTYPIVSLFNRDGEDCEPGDAVSAIAGVEGRWHVVDLRQFEGLVT